MPVLLRQKTLLAAAIVGGAVLASPASSEASPLGGARAQAAQSAVVRVHDEWDGDRYDRRRYHRRGYIRAPFTRVETRGRRWTSVDVPFASVRVRRSGVWVRAPFVDLYVPRYSRY